MPLATIVIDSPDPAMDRRDQEATFVVHALTLAAQQIARGGAMAAGNGEIIGPGGAVIGSFTLNPQAPR